MGSGHSGVNIRGRGGTARRPSAIERKTSESRARWRAESWASCRLGTPEVQALPEQFLDDPAGQGHEEPFVPDLAKSRLAGDDRLQPTGDLRERHRRRIDRGRPDRRRPRRSRPGRPAIAEPPTIEARLERANSEVGSKAGGGVGRSGNADEVPADPVGVEAATVTLTSSGSETEPSIPTTSANR